ncbi:MAG TPA: hypothetical protein VFX70_20350, partial [Mycobacteriales bacterium]|nr:hypothetical protein [Mycobacteriales bacterium]
MTAPADLPRPHPLWCARERRFRALVRAGTTDPPAGVLHHLATEIRHCCGHHPVKAHRLAWGLTVRQAVVAVGRRRRGLDERTWRRWENGAPPDTDYRNALCAFFRTSPVRLGLATDYTDHSDHPQPGDAATTATPPYHRVRSLLPKGMASMSAEPQAHPTHPAAHEATAGSANPHIPRHADRPAIERQLAMAAHESAEFHDRLAAGGPAALELLRDQASQVARSFANSPRLAVFTAARRLRDDAFAVLTDGGHLADSRDLYFITGAAC